MTRTGFLAAVLLAGYCLAATDLRLIEAVKDRNPKAVESLIGEHADVNATQPDGATPLAWAVYLNQTEAAGRLIKAGANVNAADEYGETPLTLACGIGNAPLMEKLLAAGADANAARWNGETALMIASRAGTVAGVKLLLANGAKVNATDSRRGQNALMWAAAEGHSAVVDLLIQSGAGVNVASQAGFTPLIFAAQKGDARSAGILLAAGSDPNYALSNGITVLQIAARGGNNELTSVLLEKGAQVNAADPSGNTPLHIASQAGNLELVRMLLTKHADPNARTAKIDAARQGAGGGGFFRPVGEQTPLLLAARANRESVMRALVAGGADPKIKAQAGTTLLMAAASSGHVEVVKYAYELSPDIKAVTDRKSTVMHAAVTGSMQSSTQPEICKVVQFLADKGAELDAVDGRGRTPITTANQLPIDTAVTLLAKLIEASGNTPKQSPKR